MNSSDSQDIFLGMSIFNNMNFETFINYENSRIEKSVKSFCDSIQNFLKRYFSLMGEMILRQKESKLLSNIFSTFILISNKFSSAIVINLAFPWFVSHSLELLNTSSIQIQIILQDDIKGNVKKIYPFMLKLSTMLCNCSEKVILAVSKKYFVDDIHFEMFNYFIQEAIEILFACVEKGLFKFILSPSYTANPFVISTEIPSKFNNEIKKSIDDLLKLLLKLYLLFHIEELKEYETSAINTIEIAITLMKLSEFTTNEEYELDLIHQSFSLLKTIDYSEINFSKSPNDKIVIKN